MRFIENEGFKDLPYAGRLPEPVNCATRCCGPSTSISQASAAGGSINPSSGISTGVIIALVIGAVVVAWMFFKRRRS